MLRRRIIWVFLAVLAAWVQLLLPVAASSMDRAADPFGVICGRGAAAQKDQQAPAHHGHQHDCCVLCHAYLGAAPLGERPAFTALDYPIAGPLRWRLVPARLVRSFARSEQLPRGPPSLV